jgi:hypothetical protein
LRRGGQRWINGGGKDNRGQDELAKGHACLPGIWLRAQTLTLAWD